MTFSLFAKEFGQARRSDRGERYPLGHSVSASVPIKRQNYIGGEDRGSRERGSRSSSVTSESYYPSSSDLETEDYDYEDGGWSDSEGRFREITGSTPATPKRRSFCADAEEEGDGDATPVQSKRSASAMEDLIEAAHKLNMSVSLSPERDAVVVKEAGATSMGARPRNRSASSTAHSRTASGNRRQKQRAPAAPQPRSVEQSPAPMQYPRPPGPISKGGKEREEEQHIQVRSRGGAMVMHRPKSTSDCDVQQGEGIIRPGRPFGSVGGEGEPEDGRGAAGEQQYVQEKEPPMQLWNRRRSYVASVEESPTAPPVEDDDPPSAPPPPYAAADPDPVPESSSPSSARCPHCTIHSWLPHSLSCPKNKMSRRK